MTELLSIKVIAFASSHRHAAVCFLMKPMKEMDADMARVKFLLPIMLNDLFAGREKVGLDSCDSIAYRLRPCPHFGPSSSANVAAEHLS